MRIEPLGGGALPVAVLAVAGEAVALVDRLAAGGPARVDRFRRVGRLLCLLRDRHRLALPVLAPYRWLRDADPLPHSWDVTSDSIAAWVAGAVGARRLVLVKPPGAAGGDLVDAYFSRALPAEVTAEIVASDDFLAPSST